MLTLRAMPYKYNWHRHYWWRELSAAELRTIAKIRSWLAHRRYCRKVYGFACQHKRAAHESIPF